MREGEREREREGDSKKKLLEGMLFHSIPPSIFSIHPSIYSLTHPQHSPQQGTRKGESNGTYLKVEKKGTQTVRYIIKNTHTHTHTTLGAIRYAKKL